jgi:hypothetical protein
VPARVLQTHDARPAAAVSGLARRARVRFARSSAAPGAARDQ